MCEILVRVVDKVNLNNQYLNIKCLKRGDVVCVVPDSWGWTPAEKTNPDWRIIKIPGITVDQMAGFVAPEVPNDPNKTAMLRNRGWSINLDAIAVSPAWQSWINDNSRISPTRTLNITLAVLLTYQVKKVALIDPEEFLPV